MTRVCSLGASCKILILSDNLAPVQPYGCQIKGILLILDQRKNEYTMNLPIYLAPIFPLCAITHSHQLTLVF